MSSATLARLLLMQRGMATAPLRAVRGMPDYLADAADAMRAVETAGIRIASAAGYREVRASSRSS